MKEAFLKDDAFLEDVAAARARPESLHVWWLGQSGFLIQWQGRHLLLDPYLSDSLTRKYANTDKPHVRFTERVIAPEWLDFIDVVTSSHNHTDHLDGETLGPLLSANRELMVIVPAANLDFAAERLGVFPSRLVTLDDGRRLVADALKITAIPAAHETVEKDDFGRCRYLGYVVECGPWAIYHSGDTVLYEGMVERLKKWQLDVALLPINGRKPERRVAGNLWGAEAARLAHEIHARLAIPCHFDMFEFNTATPDEFIAECRRLGQRFCVLRNGERWNSEMPLS